MKSEVNRLELTRSKILEMKYMRLDLEVEPICWVMLDNKKVVIVMHNGEYFRSDFIVSVSKELKPRENFLGAPDFKHTIWTHFLLTMCSGDTRKYVGKDEAASLKIYNKIFLYKKATEFADQVYY